MWLIRRIEGGKENLLRWSGARGIFGLMGRLFLLFFFLKDLVDRWMISLYYLAFRYERTNERCVVRNDKLVLDSLYVKY